MSLFVSTSTLKASCQTQDLGAFRGVYLPMGITSESFVCTISVRSALLRVGLGRKGDANRLDQKQSEVPEFQTHLLS